MAPAMVINAYKSSKQPFPYKASLTIPMKETKQKNLNKKSESTVVCLLLNSSLCIKAYLKWSFGLAYCHSVTSWIGSTARNIYIEKIRFKV